MSAETRADAPPAPGARAWLRLAPAVLPFLLYAPALGFGLLGYDDVYYYRLNAPLRGGAWRGLFELWAAPLYSDYFPLTQLTLWLDLAVGGERFWFARLHAIAWLAAGALGLRASIERLTGRPGLALTVATLYAVHPAAGGSVLWLAQRKNLVALALCLWSFERYLAAGTSADRGAAWKARGASFGLAAAALLAKSHAVALPAALLAYEGLLGRGSWARRLARVGPFAAAAAGMVAANLLWIRDDLGGALLGGGRLEALAADGPIVLRYLSLFAMPTLSFFYQVAEPGAASAWGWGAWAAAALAAALALALARSHRLALFAWLWGLAALAPALNLAPQPQAMANHYLHWALPGWILGLALAGEGLLERLRGDAQARAPILAAAALGLAWTALSAMQVGDYRDPRALFERAVERQPDAAEAWARYAGVLAQSPDARERMLADAAALRALECPDAERLRGQDRASLAPRAVLAVHFGGRPEEARRLLERELARFPARYALLARLVEAEVDARTGRPAEAVALLEETYTPDLRASAAALWAACSEGQALPHAMPPVAEFRLAHTDSVTSWWNREVRLRELTALARACLEAGRIQEAWEVSAVCVNLDPRRPEALAILATAYKNLGRLEAAEAVAKGSTP